MTEGGGGVGTSCIYYQTNNLFSSCVENQSRPCYLFFSSLFVSPSLCLFSLSPSPSLSASISFSYFLSLSPSLSLAEWVEFDMQDIKNVECLYY